MSDEKNWGVKIVYEDGHARWYTNDRHTKSDAARLAHHFKRYTKRDFLEDKPVTFRAQEIAEGENY